MTTDAWTKKTTETLKQFSDCFEKVDGKEHKNIFSPEEEKLAADMLRATRQRY